MATFAGDFRTLEGGLVDRLGRGDESAFRELFQQFHQRIYRTAVRILREEEAARDAVQETLVNVFRAANGFRGEAKLSTWINRITINVCLEILRKNKRHADRLEVDISELPHLVDDGRQNPEDSFRRNEVRRRVQLALADLGHKHRIVVYLHDIQGYTIREVAKILGVPEGTIKSRLFYGREELKRRLAA
ncbi:MAG TPA: sigma-70 family RNA polymerase sigma factor [Acidobacteriota bacterium]|jgi:RNA polymerase sigma-70 factor (ECF subfamily)|nr:sigma-70 family RNA polymerase sigma factor [Acidobacteriota bacterium]HRR26267.1 sigma-70 family RNA polymerase sigma factor [Acidobacteriota bacterium]HRR55643.1 sigma-70 family RNA polymerase sigma factor [Acidobacteriota bacterium]HRV07712.1 sigma-70 family RNA polymerase sigma factor [Acidobacteriota bacterium]